MVGNGGTAPLVTSDFVLRHWFYRPAAGTFPKRICGEMGSCDTLGPVRIHVDKIENGTPHALSKRDIRLIFNCVPPDWTKDIKKVRIANSLDWYAHTFYARFDGCLTIYSRNKTTEQALTSVLMELAAISLGLDRGLRSRPQAVRSRLKKMIAPFAQQLLPLITTSPTSKGHVSFAGFKELRFPFVPNDLE